MFALQLLNKTIKKKVTVAMQVPKTLTLYIFQF